MKLKVFKKFKIPLRTLWFYLTAFFGLIAVFGSKKLISKDFQEHDLFAAAKKENFTLLFEDAWNKVKQGITSVDEVLAKIPMDFIAKA